MGGWAISIGTAATDWTNDVLFGEWVPGFFDSFLLNARASLSWPTGCTA